MNNEEKILSMLEAMKADMSTMKADQAAMKADMSTMKADQAAMKADMSTMKADQAAMKADLEGVKELLQKVAVTQEAVVLPRLDLLAEGHTHLAETLAPKSRVEKLEDEVDFMKTVINALSKDVAELKKAQ